MKLIIYTSTLMLFFLIVSCKSLVYIEEDRINYETQDIKLHSTQNSQILKYYGNDFETIKWEEFSFEHHYNKKGVSFSYNQQDSLKIIKWFNARTSKNKINIENKLILDSKSKIKDIVKIFGEGGWDYDKKYTGLTLEYEYFDIIVKLSKKDINNLSRKEFVDDWDKNFSSFKNHKITEIEVY